MYSNKKVAENFKDENRQRICRTPYYFQAASEISADNIFPARMVYTALIMKIAPYKQSYATFGIESDDSQWF